MIGTLKASDVYMDMLRALPNEDKLDLISELVKSMKKAVGIKKEPKDIFARFSSDWGGDMPTEDYADMLRSENVENTRTVIGLILETGTHADIFAGSPRSPHTKKHLSAAETPARVPAASVDRLSTSVTTRQNERVLLLSLLHPFSLSRTE